MAKWLIFCSFIFCLSMTCLGLVLDLTYQIHYAPQVKSWQDSISEKKEHYLKEKSYFDGHSFFSRPISEGKDFADYLRSRIESEKDYVLINPRLQKNTLSLGEEWLEKRHLIKPSSKVEEVFNKIQSYSRWSVNKTRELNPKMEATEFIVASQIYLANMYYSEPKELVSALTKVRHMSFLLLGSENLNYKLAGLSLLEKEVDLIQFLANRRQKLHGEWKTIASEELNRYRRFLYQTYSYLSFLTEPQLLDQLFVKQDLPIGFCSVYKERRDFINWISPFLSSQFPFEPNFYENFRVLRKIDLKAQRDCHSLDGEVENFPASLSASIPYYRRIFALKILLENKKIGEDI